MYFVVLSFFFSSLFLVSRSSSDPFPIFMTSLLVGFVFNPRDYESPLTTTMWADERHTLETDSERPSHHRELPAPTHSDFLGLASLGPGPPQCHFYRHTYYIQCTCTKDDNG